MKTKNIREAYSNTQFAARVALLAKSWQPGDPCMSFKNGAPNTTVERVDGNSVYLADGTSGHSSRMLNPK